MACLSLSNSFFSYLPGHSLPSGHSSPLHMLLSFCVEALRKPALIIRSRLDDFLILLYQSTCSHRSLCLSLECEFLGKIKSTLVIYIFIYSYIQLISTRQQHGRKYICYIMVNKTNMPHSLAERVVYSIRQLSQTNKYDM